MEIMAYLFFFAFMAVIFSILLYLYIILPRDDNEINIKVVGRAKTSRLLLILLIIVSAIPVVIGFSWGGFEEFIDYLLVLGPSVICLGLFIASKASVNKIIARAENLEN